MDETENKTNWVRKHRYRNMNALSFYVWTLASNI